MAETDDPDRDILYPDLASGIVGREAYRPLYPSGSDAGMPQAGKNLFVAHDRYVWTQ